MKIADFWGLFDWNVTMCKKELFGQPYRYVDLTAGPGRYAPSFCQLSLFDEPTGWPSLCTVAIELLGKTGLPYEAHLFEKRDDNRARLDGVLGSNPCVCIYGDNVEAPSVLARVGRWKRGLICCDPNGVPDFPLLASLSRLDGFRMIDILIHYQATGQKRPRIVHGKPLLTEELAPIQKNYMKVMEPRGRQQWTWLLLSNHPRYPDWEQRHFYDVNSPEGREFLERVTYTDEEIENGVSLPELFGVSSASEVSGGRARAVPDGRRTLREVPPAAAYGASPSAVSQMGHV